MSREKKPSFTLNTVDDMFTTQEIRDERKLPRIRDIPIKAIKDFPDHPYKVKDDEDMMNLMESIKENGVLTPVTVRKIPGGSYEMISGHRRKRACELLGMPVIRGEVVELDRDEAIIMMCDSNLQRTTILPSEKAFAYKMRLDAMKRQGKRIDLTSTPVVEKLSGRDALSVTKLGNDVGESREQVRRYIRLTELIPEILELVDEGKIALRPAVEISYFPKDLQEVLVDAMEMEACTPSHAQTIRMRRLLADNKLTAESITAIMQEEKPNQKEKIILRDDRTRSLIPKDLPVNKREDYIIKALEHYGRYLKKQREQDLER
ncbi:MAG: ParB/RepB/Spo0J family partition protein [Lentihominibacter sp.]|uniref:ParB/RepB/Spo0J family partition protein n=1 Tax=Lentihominibacter sp. TaxID=2944216 RepID=UPI002A918506|nr:ParB/RepB/Spo0J family partition protein [Lentihominibacter sp.]MDY5286354.1 ParB/RepB/Spo0J family partition protein [Lentihominibacter sp.]